MPWDEGLVNSLVYDAPDPNEGRVLSYAAALREALDLALESDPAVFVLGQGVQERSIRRQYKEFCWACPA